MPMYSRTPVRQGNAYRRVTFFQRGFLQQQSQNALANSGDPAQQVSMRNLNAQCCWTQGNAPHKGANALKCLEM